jgi:hypothetical protein
MTKEKVVGLYGDAGAAAKDAGYLNLLQDKIGLNRIIFGGGFNLSPKTRQLNPSSGGNAPGLGLTDDDSSLFLGIEEAHKRGIKVWGCMSSYWAGAEHAPELMAYDLYGNRMDYYQRSPYAHEQGSMTFCPTNERINDWFEAAFTEIAIKYDFDGYALTHFRYCHPAFIEQMLGCACPSCQKKAADLGYDFPRMKKAVLGLVDSLKHLPVALLAGKSGYSFGFTDLLQVLGVDGGGVLDWFNFRADVISGNLKRFKQTVKAEVKREFAFGSDAHYPSMAMLVGHRYKDLGSICDQILPLLSHNAIHYMDNLGSFASHLTQWNNGLSERDAVRLVYMLFGITYPGMPKTVTDMDLENPMEAEKTLQTVIPEIIASEMYKAKLYSGDNVPTYPVIKGSLFWSSLNVKKLMQTALDTGHNGIILQGTDALFKYPA